MEIQGNQFAEKILKNIHKVIIGKEETVRLLLTALLADGHVLLEDVPGTGKTKLAKTLANLCMQIFPESSSHRTYCPPTLRD